VLQLCTIRLPELADDELRQYPFSVPAIRSLAGAAIELSAPVTFLVGENGSGKSTLLEALACAAGLAAVGSESVASDRTLAPVRALARRLKLAWSSRRHAGFFMRSEDFFGYVKWLRHTREEFERDLAEIDEEYKDRSEMARGLARMPIMRELHDMHARYGADLDANSHGESYFRLFQSRFVPNGVYLLDEPEAPLSPMRQIGLMAMIKQLVDEQGAQFIIATHSPILMAFPHAAIYSFDGEAIRPIAYREVEHVAVTKSFLENPQRYLRHL
jgi:predicted ATPase